MAYAAGGIPVELAKHRGHPLKSFSIPAPPSNTPLIPGQKPGKLLYNEPINQICGLIENFFF